MPHNLRVAMLAGVMLCAAPVSGQSVPASQEPVIVSSVVSGFDPAKYGMAMFNDPAQLYEMLTQEGRCPPKETADPRQPCALVFYRPELTGTKQAFNFKPVFKVENRGAIWAMHDGELRKVSAENLYWDAVMIRGVKHKYISIAVIGNAENTANCAAQRLCLKDLVAENMFLQWSKMPNNVVNMIWGKPLEKSRNTRLWPS